MVEAPVLTRVESGTQHLLPAAGSLITRIYVEWTPLTDNYVVETGGRIVLRWAGTDGVWREASVPGDARSAYLDNVAERDIVQIQVYAQNSLRQRSNNVFVWHRVIGKTALPANVAGADYDLMPNGQVQIDWTANAEADYAYTEWRLLNAGSYDTGTLIFSGKANSFMWAPGFGTFQIGGKHYDTSGNESAGTAVLTFTLNGLVLIPNNANTTVNGTTVTKVAGGAAYDAGAYSREAHAGGAFCAFSAGAAGVRILAGLNASAGAAQAEYSDIDYCLFLYTDNTVQVYESGAFMGTVSTYVPDDVFSVTYDGRVVAYWKNGSLLRALVVAPDLTMQFDCTLFTIGNSLTDIQFGPMQRENDAAFLAGNSAFVGGGFFGRRLAGSDGWDSHVYSRDSYAGGAHASCRPATTGKAYMFGLNRDPATNQSYDTIDFALYVNSSNQIEAWESNVSIGGLGATVSVGDHLAVSFDGEFVRYTKNGALLRQVEARAYANIPLFFDSSVYTTGVLLSDIKFGPMSTGGSDLRLVGRGGVEIRGRVVTKKSGGSSSWNADCYSIDGHTGGAFASTVIPGPAANYGQVCMFGLNSDPTTDSSYASLDYAFYIHNNGNLYAFESGADAAGALAAWAQGDVLMVVYDGYRVFYMQNGIVRRSVVAGTGRRFHFDSSFLWQDAALENVRFGPLSAVADIDTGQVMPGAINAPVQLDYVNESISWTYSFGSHGGARFLTNPSVTWTNTTGGPVTVQATWFAQYLGSLTNTSTSNASASCGASIGGLAGYPTGGPAADFLILAAPASGSTASFDRLLSGSTQAVVQNGETIFLSLTGTFKATGGGTASGSMTRRNAWVHLQPMKR